MAVFLGGSTTWGEGSNDEGTIPSLFSKHAQGTYKAINLGEPAYSAFHGYTHLSTRLASGLNPDLIISYDGINQLWSLISDVDYVSYYKESRFRARLEGVDHRQELSFWSLFRIIQKFTERLLFKIDFKVNQAYDFSDENVLSVAKETIESWKLINALAQYKGAKYIIVLQPNAYMGNPKKEHIILHEARQKGYKLLYDKIRELIKKPENKEIADKFYDFTDAFDIDEYIYFDDQHVAPIGNEMIAKRLLGIVNKNI